MLDLSDCTGVYVFMGPNTLGPGQRDGEPGMRELTETAPSMQLITVFRRDCVRLCAHQAAQDAHTHGSAEAYDPPIVWANRARPMPWEKADPDRVPEVGLLGKREGVLRG